jgi:translation initiation factor 3 subunit M
LISNNEYVEVEGAFNLLIVLVLGAPETVVASSVQTLVDTLTKTESNKTSLKQKM